MNVMNLNQRTPEWEAWRSQGVTASEAPIIMGRSPYKTPWRLWAERTGVTAPEDLSANPFVQRGVALEDQARQGFETRHKTLLLPLCTESKEHPALRCSLDGFSDAGEPVELKVPSAKTYEAVKDQGEAAIAYQLAWYQLQFQLYVTTADRGWLVFDTCQPRSPALEFHIERDESFIQKELVPASLRFWEAIQTGKAPPQDSNRDFYIPVDSALSEWTQAAQSYRALMEDRGQLETQIKTIKDRLAEAEDVFIRLMGQHLLAETAGVRVTRYQQNGSVDYPALLIEIAPDLDAQTLARYRKPASQRVKITLQRETNKPVTARKPAATAASSFYF
jgi:putative phage-type endonuclease